MVNLRESRNDTIALLHIQSFYKLAEALIYSRGIFLPGEEVSVSIHVMVPCNVPVCIISRGMVPSLPKYACIYTMS